MYHFVLVDADYFCNATLLRALVVCGRYILKPARLISCHHRQIKMKKELIKLKKSQRKKNFTNISTDLSSKDTKPEKMSASRAFEK